MLRLFRPGFLVAAATALGVFAFGASAASSDVGLQSVNLACNDGTNLNVGLDPSALTSLANAVSAINLYPAGDPALGCSLSPGSDPFGASGPKDFAVGGGRELVFGQPGTIALSAHATSDAATTQPQPGVGGTVNTTSSMDNSHLDSKVDCFVSPAPSDPVLGTAQATAVVTRSTGAFSFIPPGSEVRWDFFDSGVPGPAPNGDAAAGHLASSPCTFSYYSPALQLTNGNISVHNDDP